MRRQQAERHPRGGGDARDVLYAHALQRTRIGHPTDHRTSVPGRVWRADCWDRLQCPREGWRRATRRPAGRRSDRPTAGRRTEPRYSDDAVASYCLGWSVRSCLKRYQRWTYSQTLLYKFICARQTCTLRWQLFCRCPETNCKKLYGLKLQGYSALNRSRTAAIMKKIRSFAAQTGGRLHNFIPFVSKWEISAGRRPYRFWK